MMTRSEYNSIKLSIVKRHNAMMAALETIWSFCNGENPPDSPVVHRTVSGGEDSQAVADTLMVPDAPDVRAPHVKLSKEEKQAKKREYMRAYMAKRKAAQGK